MKIATGKAVLLSWASMKLRSRVYRDAVRKECPATVCALRYNLRFYIPSSLNRKCLQQCRTWKWVYYVFQYLRINILQNRIFPSSWSWRRVNWLEIYQLLD
jgi:hypothetical protein